MSTPAPGEVHSNADGDPSSSSSPVAAADESSSPNEPPHDDHPRRQQQQQDDDDDGDDPASANIYCRCPRPAFCKKCGNPLASRKASADALTALVRDHRPDGAGVFGNGPLLLSDCPASTTTKKEKENTGVVLGIE